VKKHGAIIMMVGSALLSLSVGCKNKEVSQQSRSAVETPMNPAPAPGSSAAPGGQAQPERIVIDDEVRTSWKAVELLVVEKKPGGASQTVQVGLGGESPVAGTALSIKVLGFVPDFAMGNDSIITKSMQDVNPAVKIQILENGKELFKGWAFRNFPTMHPFEDPRYRITLARAVPARP